MERVTAISRHREPMTTAEFLDWENQQEDKYEYFDGVVRMMTGGTLAHSVIAENTRAALRRIARPSGCLVVADFKLAASDAVTYPDAVVLCAPPDDRATHAATADVIVEVLSKSTENFDRGPKWVAYQRIDGLRAYLLVAQTTRRIELYRRASDDWLYTILQSGTFDLPGFQGEISIDEIYDGVKV